MDCMVRRWGLQLLFYFLFLCSRFLLLLFCDCHSFFFILLWCSCILLLFCIGWCFAGSNRFCTAPLSQNMSYVLVSNY
jgi:hypothetical protein